MGGWNPNALPQRPGAYFNFVSQPTVTIPPSSGQIVALPLTHSWGPDGQVVACNAMSDFIGIFGIDLASAGYKAVWQAFNGENVRGRRGAGQVLVYRMCGSAGAKAGLTLQNTTPANALTVTARYKGTVGNGLSVTIRTDPNNGAKKDFVVLLGSTEVEVYPYAPTDLAGLATAVNAVSNWVTLTVLVNGVALATVTSSPLTGGNDGASLVSGNWTAAMAALETQRFGYCVPFDLTDGAILASMVAWAQNANANGRRFFLVTGGALNEDDTAAVARAGTMDDPDLLTVGFGSITQADLLDTNGNPVVLSSSQFAPRIAGIAAALGDARSLTGARMGGSVLTVGATQAQIINCFNGGVIVLSMDSDPDAPVRIEKGLTTWTTKTDPKRPYLIFREPKFVRTMHDLADEITTWFQSNVLGQLPVNSKTRSAVVAELKRRLAAREKIGSIQSGWTVSISANPPASDSDDFVALDYSIAFGRSVEKLLNSIMVS